jgi:hypothetical protein
MTKGDPFGFKVAGVVGTPMNEFVHHRLQNGRFDWPTNGRHDTTNPAHG